MLIVADENIPLLDSFFSDFGDIRRVSGRELSPDQVRDADVLLVRSVTRVNRDLLEGSRVRFVGTTTIGTDHIDQFWLESQGIHFCAAPGCNANSVVEYVLAVASLHASRRGLSNWARQSVGIVGAGNVGGLLAQRLERLGFTVVLCDPPRQQAQFDGLDESSATEFSSLEQALECDMVTLHTPLTREGEYPTYHLLGAQELAILRPDQLLINSGRGEVINNADLLARLQQPDAPTVVLDVWENEPNIDPQLLQQVWLGTPHIAGYSLEGKVHGTETIYRALSRFLGLPVRKQAGQYLPQPPLSKLAFTSNAGDDAIQQALHNCYDPRRDDARLRLSMAGDEQQRAQAFDRLRKEYPV
ncbi:MAG: erythronate-4-phosphate dehydrogenase, partial [Marinobacter psychrophilus]